MSVIIDGLRTAGTGTRCGPGNGQGGCTRRSGLSLGGYRRRPAARTRHAVTSRLPGIPVNCAEVLFRQGSNRSAWHLERFRAVHGEAHPRALLVGQRPCASPTASALGQKRTQILPAPPPVSSVGLHRNRHRVPGGRRAGLAAGLPPPRRHTRREPMLSRRLGGPSPQLRATARKNDRYAAHHSGL